MFRGALDLYLESHGVLRPRDSQGNRPVGALPWRAMGYAGIEPEKLRPMAAASLARSVGRTIEILGRA